MPTIAEALKASGWTDERIAALDQEAMKVINDWGTQTISTADQLRQAAELKERALKDKLTNEINPALNKWDLEKNTLEMEKAALLKALESAKSQGYQVPEISVGSPTLDGQPPRNDKGQFVANANPVPGSPAYLTPAQAIKVQNEAMWALSEHMRLKGEPLPDEIEKILAEAEAQHMNFRQYVAQKYGFDAARKAAEDKKIKEREDAIRKEVATERDKYWAERTSGNPMVRPAEQSQFSQIQKAVAEKKIADPLTMSAQERRQQTRQLIHKDIAERETEQVQ